MAALFNVLSQLVDFVINLVSSLLEFIVSLPTYVALLVQTMGVLPFGLSAFAMMLVTVGVIKLIIGRQS